MATQITLRTRKGKQVLFEPNFKFASAVDINKCLKQGKLLISLGTSEPSHKGSMGSPIERRIGKIARKYSKARLENRVLDSDSGIFCRIRIKPRRRFFFG